jgi:hypothetical protein
MQAEIIKSLQLAVKYDNAILNLQILHEASIVNRKESIVVLDELKQRILIVRPMPRTLRGTPEERRASVETLQTFRTANMTPVPDDYIPTAVTIPAPGEAKEQKTGLARYFSMKRSNSQSSTSSAQRPVSSTGSLTFSPALNHLMQGSDSRAAIMKDIDDIISSYQGLYVDGDGKRDTWIPMNGGAYGNSSKRDTLTILNAGGDQYKRDTANLNRDAIQMLRNLPPTPEEPHGNTEYPAMNHNVFGQQQQQYGQYIAAPQPLAHRNLQPESRWSATSSVYSDVAPPSLYSRDSRSSNDSPISPDRSPRASVVSVNPFPHHSATLQQLQAGPQYIASQQQHQQHQQQQHQQQPIAPYAAPQRTNSPPLGSHVPPQQTGMPPIAPFSFPPRPSTPIKDDNGVLTANKTRVHLVPDQNPLTASSSNSVSSSSTGTTRPGISALATSSSVFAAPGSSSQPPPKPLVHTRSNSSSNPSIRTNTIQSPTNVTETMMSGRPCKENNYWGFCKGAWATREEVKRGLGLQTRPDGMYNTHQIWQCKHCHFEGATFSAPHPTKKGKKETIVDPAVYTSAVGIRYKWLFLAKSHVKKKSMDGAVGPARKKGGEGEGDCNFGCVICSVEGNVTGIYGNVETLMNHIFLEHVQGGKMSEKIAVKSGCILGRVAAPDEKWDLNVPVWEISI